MVCNCNFGQSFKAGESVFQEALKKGTMTIADANRETLRRMIAYDNTGVATDLACVIADGTATQELIDLALASGDPAVMRAVATALVANKSSNELIAMGYGENQQVNDAFRTANPGAILSNLVDEFSLNKVGDAGTYPGYLWDRIGNGDTTAKTWLETIANGTNEYQKLAVVRELLNTGAKEYDIGKLPGGQQLLGTLGNQDQDTLITLHLNETLAIANIYNQANPGAHIENLVGIFDQDQAMDPDYIKIRIDNGDENALKLIKTTSESSEPDIHKVLLTHVLVTAGYTEYEINNMGGSNLLTAYSKFYDDERNWIPKVDPITVSSYGSDAYAEMLDPLGNKHKIDIVVNGKLIGLDGTPGEEGSGYVKVKKGFDNAEYTLQAERFFYEVRCAEDPEAAYAQFLADIAKDPKSWFDCVGTGCTAAAPASTSSGGGGGGGGGGSSQRQASTTAPKGTLFVDSKGIDADVIANVKNENTDEIQQYLIGKTDKTIELTPGTYNITISKKGYYSKTMDIQIKAGSAKTVSATLYEKPIDVCIMIEELGGVDSLNWDHYLYLFAKWKYQVTSKTGWLDIISTITLNPALTTMPERLESNDLRFCYYILTGQGDKATQLITENLVCPELEA